MVFTGRAVGAALGGVFFEAYSPRTMFRIFAVVSFLFLVILVILLEATKRRQSPGTAENVAVGRLSYCIKICNYFPNYLCYIEHKKVNQIRSIFIYRLLDAKVNAEFAWEVGWGFKNTSDQGKVLFWPSNPRNHAC